MDGALRAAGERATGGAIPLFHAQWWLDAAAGKPCDGVTVERNGETVGALRYYRTRRLGLTRLRMPPFTRTLGPSLFLPPSKPATHIAAVRHIVADLLRRLPPHDLLEFALDPESDPAIGFACEQAGLTLGQTFTFRTRAGDRPAALWKALDQKRRNVIRTASQACAPAQAGPFSAFAELYAAEYPDGADLLAALARLHMAAEANGQGEVRVVTSGDGVVFGAAFLAWDDRVLYLLATTRRRDAPGAAASLLVWDAIERAHELGRSLDLDGYKTAGWARFLASFGLTLCTRPVMRRRSLRYALAEAAGRRMRREDR